MFCPECGSENPDDAAFCGSCGKAIGNARNEPAPEPEPISRVVDLSGDADAVPNGLKWGVVVASLFLPLIGVIMGIYYLVKGESEARKAVGRLWLYTGIGIAFLYFLVAGGGY